MVPIYGYAFSRSLDSAFYYSFKSIHHPPGDSSKYLEICFQYYYPLSLTHVCISSCLGSHNDKCRIFQVSRKSRAYSKCRFWESPSHINRRRPRSGVFELFSYIFIAPCYRIPRVFYSGYLIHSHLCPRVITYAFAYSSRRSEAY